MKEPKTNPYTLIIIFVLYAYFAACVALITYSMGKINERCVLDKLEHDRVLNKLDTLCEYGVDNFEIEGEVIKATCGTHEYMF